MLTPKTDLPPLDKSLLKADAKYRLEKPFYIDDTLYDEGTEIVFGGIPNETMFPLNEDARANLNLFYKSNGGKTPDVADVSEAAYMNRPKEGSVTVVAPRQPPPVMGNINRDGSAITAPTKPPTVKNVTPPTTPQFVRPIAQAVGAGKEGI